MIAPMSVPLTELAAAWLGTHMAVNELQANQIWLEADSSTVIKWLDNSSRDGGKIFQL